MHAPQEYIFSLRNLHLKPDNDRHPTASGVQQSVVYGHEPLATLIHDLQHETKPGQFDISQRTYQLLDRIQYTLEGDDYNEGVKVHLKICENGLLQLNGVSTLVKMDKDEDLIQKSLGFSVLERALKMARENKYLEDRKVNPNAKLHVRDEPLAEYFNIDELMEMMPKLRKRIPEQKFEYGAGLPLEGAAPMKGEDSIVISQREVGGGR